MFACLFSSSASQDSSLQDSLLALASSFSPLVEDTAPGVVVFSIVGLSKLIGTVDQIASAIARAGAEALAGKTPPNKTVQKGKIQVNLAISADPDAAVIAARHKGGLTIIPPGREADRLSGLPLHVLGDFIADGDLRILDTLDRWGIKTLGELAALPPLGFIARFGEPGERLLRLARGETQRALRVRPAPETYERRVDLEHPQVLLEPLLFVVSSLLQELTEALARQGLATNRVTLGLRLVHRMDDKNSVHQRTLEFPVPVRDPQVLLKQLQFDLEAHPPKAAILGVQVRLHPVEPRPLQHGLFLPQAPAPEKLSLTLARLTALVGEGNAGSPELLDTHRPDAFRMRTFSPSSAPIQREKGEKGEKGDRLLCPQQTAAGLQQESLRGQSCLSPFSKDGGAFRFAFRYSRPAPSAQVRLKSERPILVKFQTHVSTREVLASAGPWRASGDWWTASPWDREEWDLELSDGGLYRVFRASREWFLEGVYD
jgi:protein ImuB